MISISISSYQVVNRVCKNVKIVVRSRILPRNYQIWPKVKEMNMMQKKSSMKGNMIFFIVSFISLVISIWLIPHEDTYKIVNKRHSFDF